MNGFEAKDRGLRNPSSILSVQTILKLRYAHHCSSHKQALARNDPAHPESYNLTIRIKKKQTSQGTLYFCAKLAIHVQCSGQLPLGARSSCPNSAAEHAALPALRGVWGTGCVRYRGDPRLRTQALPGISCSDQGTRQSEILGREPGLSHSAWTTFPGQKEKGKKKKGELTKGKRGNNNPVGEIQANLALYATKNTILTFFHAIYMYFKETTQTI